MNMKVGYRVQEEAKPEPTLKHGFLQDFIAIDGKVKGILIVGKEFLTVPIEDLIIERTLI